jgi:hypothetical protein
MGMPEVTIIIICRDRMDLLPEAVASVLSQSVRNIEVLIIHGGDRAVPMAESVSPANPSAMPGSGSFPIPVREIPRKP